MRQITPRFVMFDSPAEASRAHSAANYTWPEASSNLSWYGGETVGQSRQRAIDGSDDGMAEAEALRARLMVTAQTGTQTDEPDIMGCYPVVPEALAGIPDCMRMPTDTSSDRAPVRIFASITVSGGISASDIRKRGITLLALASSVAAARPCDLYVFTEQGNYSGRDESGDTVSVCAVRIPIQNGILKQTAYALTSTGFIRRICYELCGKHCNGDGLWAVPKRTSAGEVRTAAHEKGMRRIMGLAERDVYVPSLYIEDDMLSQPEQWIARELARINAAD